MGSHNLLDDPRILCAEAEWRNFKCQYIPSAEVELRHRIT